MGHQAAVVPHYTRRMDERFTSTASVRGSSVSPLPPPADIAAVQKPKLLDRVREAIRTRHYSLRTEKAYVHWIKRFIFFHNKRHPQEMGEGEIGQFLSALATESQVTRVLPNE